MVFCYMECMKFNQGNNVAARSIYMGENNTVWLYVTANDGFKCTASESDITMINKLPKQTLTDFAVRKRHETFE